jgi:DNA-binding response OmpR family regulator
LLLLVEDDDMVRSLTRQVLEKAGYQVLEARDGEDAMEVFMAHAAEVQLLVLDVVMPRMDGRALYDNISELRPGVPVLFCSSYSADLLESEYMLQVGGSLLAKPYRAVELLRRVRAMLDRGAWTRPDPRSGRVRTATPCRLQWTARGSRGSVLMQANSLLCLILMRKTPKPGLASVLQGETMPPVRVHRRQKGYDHACA